MSVRNAITKLELKVKLAKSKQDFRNRLVAIGEPTENFLEEFQPPAFSSVGQVDPRIF
jgi:hypothetical protein